MLDWGIWVAFGKENFIKQFLVLHLILFSLQKVKMASTGCSSFSADSARVKRREERGRGDQENKFHQRSRVGAFPLGAGRGRAGHARGRSVST